MISFIDCTGECAPDYVGDDECDDGTDADFPYDFSCPELDYDGGDCPS